MKKFTSKLLSENLNRFLRKKWIYILFIVFFLPWHSFAQWHQNSPDMVLDVSAKGSDYQLTFTFSGAEAAAPCVFPVGHQFRIFKDVFDYDSPFAKVDYEVPQSSGSFSIDAGPNISGNWQLRYDEIGLSCFEYVLSDKKNAATSPIKSPNGITVSDQDYYDKIVVSWDKGTDIPDDKVKYRIYRGTSTDNGVLVYETSSGGDRSWTDTDIFPNDQYYYWVTTYSFTPYWGVHESPHNGGNAHLGKAKTININASDGLYTSRVKIEWGDISELAEEIRIERSVPGSSEKEELAILSKNAMAYSDNEAIPGYNYTYYVTPIQKTRTLPSLSDTGYMKPNGTIKGTVTSLFGTGVEGVQVCAKPITPDLPTGANSIPSDGYCAITDIDGYYEIRNIYYFDEAEFIIVASKAGPIGDHIFSPDTIIRILDLNSKLSSGANFTDESVFTVGGKVTYPPSSTNVECGIPEVEILFNGGSRGIFTDSNGNWSYAIQDEGTYTFTPKFHHHYFENSFQETSTKVFVDDDIDNIDFIDLQVDSIMIRVQGGCGDAVANSVTLQIMADDCYNKIVATDADGFYTARDLPARKYSVQVISLDSQNNNSLNILEQIGNKPVIVDLTVRDSANIISQRESTIITPQVLSLASNGDTIQYVPEKTEIIEVTETVWSDVTPKAEFIYHSPLNIQVDFIDAGAEVFTCSDPNKIVMEQYNTYSLVFNVSEQLGDCPIKEGRLLIFDFVGDNGDTPVEVPIENGFAVYNLKAGEPEIAESAEHNHEKLLYVLPEVGFLDAQPIEYWITVTGVKTQAPSFITQSPSLPMLILHDPPGDNSYAYVEKGTSFKSFETTEVLVGGEAGIFANLLIGAKILTPFSSTGFGTLLRFTAVAGKDNYDRNGLETTITFNERWSTSDLENLTGNDGDVYIGASYNQIFAYGDELSFDPSSCETTVTAVPTIDINGFATTFVYTEKHILNTLIPKLGELRRDLIAGRSESELTEEEKIQANQLSYDSIHWRRVIAQNTANRDTSAIFKKNISFNAGAVYSSEFVSDTVNSTSYEYNTFINNDFAAGIKIDNATGAWFDSELGVTAKFRWGTTTNTGKDTTTTRTVGYMLNDNDIGDYFSVDVKEDLAYGVPSFTLKSGTTSCPHEPGSQSRDNARIQIYPPQINNVPIGGKAVFTANLLNESQSRETREYHVRAISTTNPDGAIIKIGGEQINNKPASFFLDFNQTANVALTVEKGPLAATYDSIGIMMFPPCEYALWEDNGNITGGDTAWIFVDFQTDCSNVTLQLPGDGWLVNQNNNDILNIAFTGYDLNNDNLESITLQFKKEGEGWIDYLTVNKNDLLQNFFEYAFNVSSFSDGNYRLRAKTFCGFEGGTSYSSEQKGIIDRSSVAPFGLPSPSDGFLRFGQEISVNFDKNINCNFESYNPSISTAYVKLFLEDGTEIPSTVQCSENQDKIIIVPNQDLFSQSALEGVKLYAVVDSIQDVSGNVQEYKTEWSFLVNVSPVSWNPEEVHLTAVENDDIVISANLDNSASISKSFTISEWPDWLTPSVTSASILSGNSFTLQFHADADLKPGLYQGQVVALIDDVPEILQITLELYAKDVSWNINHQNFEYNMNVIAQFSSDAGDNNLSTGLRDKIAAYVNGELRGVGNITFVPELNKYAAFINIVSNASGANGSYFESEDYVNDLSVQDIISVSDNGTNSGATRFKKANWIDFNIYATRDGTFDLQLRLASILTNKTVGLLVDGTLKQTFTVPNTGNLNTYTTLATTLQVNSGPHVLRILSNDAEFDLNWFNFPQYHVRNANSNEVIKFRMWDGLNGIEYGAVEELTFFNDGVVGSAENPFILHPAGGIQSILLSKGWNWISVNKQSPDMSVGKTFESLTPPTSLNDLTLKSQTAYAQFNQNTGWMGTLTDVNLESGYMIFLSAQEDTLILIGNPPSTDTQIPLNTKWNWIGFPKQGVLPVDEVLGTLSSDNGDIIKGQTKFAEYNSTSDTWIGDLKFFEPGKGYKLFVSNPDNLNILKSGSPDDLYLKHEYNMTLTAVINFGNFPVSENYELRTYVGDQLRGEIPLTYVNNLGEYMAFTMIYGDRSDIGDDVTAVLWDNYNQREVALSSPGISFGIDKINGTISDPVVLAVVENEIAPAGDNLMDFRYYPNPFSSEINFNYSISNETHVTLMITDSFGKEIVRIVDDNQNSGNYNYVFDGKSLAAGIYYCTFKTNENVETRKLIRLKE